MGELSMLQIKLDSLQKLKLDKLEVEILNSKLVCLYKKIDKDNDSPKDETESENFKKMTNVMVNIQNDLSNFKDKFSIFQNRININFKNFLQKNLFDEFKESISDKLNLNSNKLYNEINHKIDVNDAIKLIDKSIVKSTILYKESNVNDLMLTKRNVKIDAKCASCNTKVDAIDSDSGQYTNWDKFPGKKYKKDHKRKEIL